MDVSRESPDVTTKPKCDDLANILVRSVEHLLGSASERAKGWGAVWTKSGHSVQYHYRMLLAGLGMGESERANTSAGSRAQLGFGFDRR